MTKEEELRRTIEDRDVAESDAELIGQEMADLERAFPDSYEELDDWNALHHEHNALENEAMYLTRCIEELEDEVLSGVH